MCLQEQKLSNSHLLPECKVISNIVGISIIEVAFILIGFIFSFLFLESTGTDVISASYRARGNSLPGGRKVVVACQNWKAVIELCAIFIIIHLFIVIKTLPEHSFENNFNPLNNLVTESSITVGRFEVFLCSLDFGCTH